MRSARRNLTSGALSYVGNNCRLKNVIDATETKLYKAMRKMRKLKPVFLPKTLPLLCYAFVSPQLLDVDGSQTF